MGTGSPEADGLTRAELNELGSVGLCLVWLKLRFSRRSVGVGRRNIPIHTGIFMSLIKIIRCVEGSH